MAEHRERYPWYGYMKNIIRRYPVAKAEYEAALRQQRTTAAYGEKPRGSGKSASPVEKAVIHAMRGGNYADFLAVDRAVKATDPEHLQLIDLVFWRKSKTIEGAAAALYISTSTARRRIKAFIIRVARERGLI